jgi:hypothetical protein
VLLPSYVSLRVILIYPICPIGRGEKATSGEYVFI